MRVVTERVKLSGLAPSSRSRSLADGVASCFRGSVVGSNSPRLQRAVSRGCQSSCGTKWAQNFEPSFVAGSKAFSDGSPCPTEVLPGTAIRVTLRMQDFRAGVFGGVKLKDHPLGIRNARIRRGVQDPNVVVRK